MERIEKSEIQSSKSTMCDFIYDLNYCMIKQH